MFLVVGKSYQCQGHTWRILNVRFAGSHPGSGWSHVLQELQSSGIGTENP